MGSAEAEVANNPVRKNTRMTSVSTLFDRMRYSFLYDETNLRELTAIQGRISMELKNGRMEQKPVKTNWR